MFDAARLGRDNVVAALLHAKAAIDGRDERGYTSLILTSYNGHVSTTALLLQAGADPAVTDAAGNSARGVAAAQGNPAMAQRLDRAARSDGGGTANSSDD